MNRLATKAEWRAWGRSTRAKLFDVSEPICAHISQFLSASSALVVASYVAFGSEIDLGSLVALHPDVAWLTTRTEADNTLTLHPFEAATQRSPFGVLEPPRDAIPTSLIPDLVLVPGLVFDCQGTRLGYGKGFYDRLLSSLDPATVRIGVTNDALIVDHLPAEPFDIPMTHLVSESGLRALLPTTVQM